MNKVLKTLNSSFTKNIRIRAEINYNSFSHIEIPRQTVFFKGSPFFNAVSTRLKNFNCSRKRSFSSFTKINESDPGLLIQNLSRLLASESENEFELNQAFITEDLLSKVFQELIRFSTYHLYQLLLILSRKKVCPEKLFPDLITEFNNRIMDKVFSCDLSNSTFSELPLLLSNLDLKPENITLVHSFLDSYSQDAIRRFIECDLENPSSSYSLNSYPDLSNGNTNNLSFYNSYKTKFSFRDISFISLGLSNLGYRKLKLFDLMSDYLIHQLDSSNTIHFINKKSNLEKLSLGSYLTTIILSYSTLGIANPIFYKQIFRYISAYIPYLQPSHITNLALSLATLSETEEFPLSLSFMKDFENSILKFESSFSQLDSVSLCWALCSLQLYKSIPQCFIKLMKNLLLYWPLEEIIEDYQTLTQLNQIRLTIEHDSHPICKKVKNELVASGIWKILFKANHHQEKGHTSEEIFSILNIFLENAANSKNFYYKLSEILQISSEGPTNFFIESSTYIEDFYFAPVILIYSDSYKNSSEILSCSINQLDPPCCKITFFPVLDQDKFQPIDSFNILKRRHLSQLGWIQAPIEEAKIKDMKNSTNLLNYLINQIHDFKDNYQFIKAA